MDLYTWTLLQVVTAPHFLLSKGAEVALIEGRWPVKAVLWFLIPGEALCVCVGGMFSRPQEGKFVASQHPVRPSLCPHPTSHPPRTLKPCEDSLWEDYHIIPSGHIQGYREKRLKFSRQMSCCWKLSRVPELSSLPPHMIL